MAKRVRFNRGHLPSAVDAAIRLDSDTALFVFSTANGYTIERRQPPFRQSHVKVANGQVVTHNYDPVTATWTEAAA